jgi:predicted DNA binding CopG/RHH family protein
MSATPLRAIRIPAPLWDAARTKASTEGRNVSDIIRELLAEWLAEN